MQRFFLFIALTLLIGGRVSAQTLPVPPLMNFQGRLTKPDGTPVPNGAYSIRFSLWNAASAGTEKWNETISNVAVNNGAFSVLLNVSAGAADKFNGNLWLEVKIGTDAALTPRQQLVSVAYAMKANAVADSAITSASIADGAITAADLAAGTLSPLAWLLNGNAGTNPATQFLGTTDNQPLNLRANNSRGLRLEWVTGAELSGMNVLGGHFGNNITTGAAVATIAGGGYRFVDGASILLAYNRVTDTGGTVGGGASNRAGDNQNTPDDARFATVAGGHNNIAAGEYASIGGGYSNQANNTATAVGGGQSNFATSFAAFVGGGENNRATSSFSVVGGGYSNLAGGDDTGRATVAGGNSNTANGRYSSVGGGNDNTASGRSATVPGGNDNTAAGQFSFAAGNHARANHDGAFVWADGLSNDFASSANNQFNVRASGGVRIFTNGTLSAGVTLTAGDSTWNSVSDRNAKMNFRAVDTSAILERLVALPITTWNYKANANIRHLGVMAQDFYAAFGGLGTDDKHISGVDADGVAFAAIQGLHHQALAQQRQMDEMRAENAALKRQLAELAAFVHQLKRAPQDALR